MAAGARALWAAADEVYGRCGEFRDALRALSLAYVVIIPCDYRVTLARDKAIRADEAIAGAVFERRSCGNGTKGPRYSDWALIATAGPREFLLIRRLPRGRRTSTHLPVPRAAGPPGHDDLLRHHHRPPLAGRNNFRDGKDTLGWDQSQARTWDAICRHTALTALAQLRTAAVRAAMTGAAALPAAGPPPSTAATGSEATVSGADLRFYPDGAPVPVRGGQPCPPGIPPIELSAPETARIERLARDWKAGLLTRARLAFHLRWSHWHRRHQARARWHHYSTRLPGTRHLTQGDRKEVTPCNRQHGTMHHAELRRGHRPKNSNCNTWDGLGLAARVSAKDRTCAFPGQGGDHRQDSGGDRRLEAGGSGGCCWYPRWAWRSSAS